MVSEIQAYNKGPARYVGQTVSLPRHRVDSPLRGFVRGDTYGEEGEWRVQRFYHIR